MHLTESQLLIIRILKSCGLVSEEVQVVLIQLRTEDQQWNLLDWYEDYLEENKARPPKDEIFAEVDLIEKAA